MRLGPMYSLFEPRIKISSRTGDVLVRLSSADMAALADEYFEWAVSSDYPWDPGDLHEYFIKPAGPRGIQVLYGRNTEWDELELKQIAPRLQKMLEEDYIWVLLQADMVDQAHKAGVEKALGDPSKAMEQAVRSGVLGQRPRDDSVRGTAMAFGTEVRKGLGKGGKVGTAMPFGTGAVRIKNASVRVSHQPRFSSGPAEYRVDYSPRDVDRFLRRKFREGKMSKEQVQRAVEVLQPARKRGAAVVFNDVDWPVAGDQRTIPHLRAWEVWTHVLHEMLPWTIDQIIAEKQAARKSMRRGARGGSVPRGSDGLEFGTAQFSGTQMGPGTARPSARGGGAPAFRFGTAGAGPDPVASDAFKFGVGRRTKNETSRRLMNRLRRK